MKVLIITFGFPNKNNPQLGNFMIDQAIALRNNGIDIAMLAIRRDSSASNKKFFGLNYWEFKGIKCFEFTGLPLKSFKKFINFKFGEFLEKSIINYIIPSIIKKFGKPDLIHAHYLSNISYGIFLKEKLNIPLLATEHWSKLATDNPSPFIMREAKQYYPKVDQLITVSPFLHTKILKNFGVSSIVIPNILGQEFINPKIIPNDNEKFTFIAVGSLLHVKGYDILLEAVKKLNLPPDKWILKIIGKGPLINRLNKYVIENNLENNIFLLGQKNKHEIVSELRKSDCFILSSRSETFGVVIIEALSQGLPVIASDCGGTKDLIDDSNGLLVPTNNPSLLAKAMEDVFFHFDKYNNFKISNDCILKFSPTKIAEDIISVYQKLLY